MRNSVLVEDPAKVGQSGSLSLKQKEVLDIVKGQVFLNEIALVVVNVEFELRLHGRSVAVFNRISRIKESF